MKNLVVKIKSYQEDNTYLTLNIPNWLDNTQIMEFSRAAKTLVDKMVGKIPGHPNLIRFESEGKVFTQYQMEMILND